MAHVSEVQSLWDVRLAALATGAGALAGKCLLVSGAGVTDNGQATNLIDL